MKINSKDCSWYEADHLFLKDDYWVGADDAYSIKLDSGKILWLFGDTLIAKNKGNRNREPEDTFFINNTIGISDNENPVKSKIKYYWNEKEPGKPVSFFKCPEIPEENWLWPGNGVVVDEKYLILFFMNIKPEDNDWGFDIAGWQVAIVENYKENPEKWDIRWGKPSEFKKFNTMIGCGGVVYENDYIYAYGSERAIADNRIFLVRWNKNILSDELFDFSNSEWWCGEKSGWSKENKINPDIVYPEVVWENGQNEFTVNRFPGEKFYMLTQFMWHNATPGNADLVCRISDSLTGPWSKIITLYKDMYRVEDVPEDLNVYAGKFHPEMNEGSDNNLIFTYATNTRKLETLWARNEIYYPGFIKLKKDNVIEKIKNEVG